MAPKDVIQSYINEINKVSLLTQEEEVKLAKIIREGDSYEQECARDTLIRANLRLVVKVAHRYAHSGLPLRDLISIGNVGLIRAVELFDPERGNRFSTYAILWIKQAIRYEISRQIRPIRIPTLVTQRLQKIKELQERYEQTHKREMSVSELANALSLPIKTIENILRSDLNFVSMDQTLENFDNSLADSISDKNAISPSKIIEQFDSLTELDEILEQLTPRERKVLTMRFGLDGTVPRTLAEIGATINLTKERVRQIEMSTLHKIRMIMEQLN